MRTVRRMATLAALPALLLALAGCTREAGAAAVVGDRRISVAELQAAYRDVKPLFGADSRVSQADVLMALIAEPYLVEEAGRLGQGVSDFDAGQQFEEVKDDVPDPSPAAITAVRAFMAAATLQSEDRSREAITRSFQEIGDALDRDGVHINPRYGASFNKDDFTLRPSSPNWLVKSSTSSEPSPQP